MRCCLSAHVYVMIIITGACNEALFYWPISTDDQKHENVFFDD